MRAWTDPNKLAVAYGDRKISAIIKMPSSLAYIVLITVCDNKLKYDEDDLVVYSRFLSILEDAHVHVGLGHSLDCRFQTSVPPVPDIVSAKSNWHFFLRRTPGTL